jgi:hypothetical protein
MIHGMTDAPHVAAPSQVVPSSRPVGAVTADASDPIRPSRSPRGRRQRRSADQFRLTHCAAASVDAASMSTRGHRHLHVLVAPQLRGHHDRANPCESAGDGQCLMHATHRDSVPSVFLRPATQPCHRRCRHLRRIHLQRWKSFPGNAIRPHRLCGRGVGETSRDKIGRVACGKYRTGDTCQGEERGGRRSPPTRLRRVGRRALVGAVDAGT